jgi:hypothetical protein
MIFLLDIIAALILEHELSSILHALNNFFEIMLVGLSSGWWTIVPMLKKWMITFEYKDYSPFYSLSSLEKWSYMYDRCLWWYFVYFKYDYGWARIILPFVFFYFLFKLPYIEKYLINEVLP